MATSLEAVIGVTTGAAGIIGAIALVVRYVVKKTVDQAFVQFEKIANEKLSLQAELAKDYAKTQFTVYPAIAELVYRAKIGATEVRKATTNVEVLNDELLASCRELTDQLFRMRIYLPADLFKDLHNYKHLLQDLIVIGDYLTRPSSGNVTRELSPESQAHVRELCQDLSVLCDEIESKLQTHMKSLQGFLITESSSETVR